MIRDWLVVAGLCAGLAGCSPSRYPTSPTGEPAGSPVNISGTAVAGVTGGSGSSPRMVSGIKDLELSVGVDLGSR